MRQIYPIQLDLIPLILIFLTVYLTINGYAGLPEAIPTHFNFQGIPDDYGPKPEIWTFTGMSLFIYLLLTGIMGAIAVAPKPQNLINLPGRIKKNLSETGVEQLRKLMVRSLLAMKIIVLGLDFYLLWGSLRIAYHQMKSIGYWPLFFVFLILVIAGYMVYKSYRISGAERQNL